MKDLLALIGPLRSENPPYSCVADVGNYLFFLPPPPEVQVVPDKKRRIDELLKRINDSLLTATYEQLQSIQSILLVAGGRRKGLVIKHLLEEQDLQIRTLCTSDAAAKVILGH